ncbi:unnamed protein product [Rhodiola kirilowii]
MFSIATIAVFAFFGFSLFKFFHRSSGKYKNYSLPPGPSPWPIIGCLTQMLKAENKYKWIFGLMKGLNTGILCIRIGNVHVIPVISPKIASEFLKEKDAIFVARPKSLAAALVSHGYMGTVLSSGNQWTKMRKMLTQELFSPAMHKWFHEKRVEETDNLVAYVYNLLDGVVDLRKTTFYYSTNVIRRLMFNKRYFGEVMPDKGPGALEQEHADSVMQTLKYTFSFAISDFFPTLTGVDFDGKEKNAVEAVKALEKYQNPIIEERIRKWRKTSNSSSNHTDKEDMLDIMVNLKDSDGKPLLSEAEIKGQVNELIIGATDNSSNAVEWAMAEMLNQPSIMRKAVEELDLVVGKERLVQESDIPELKYIKAILMEAFRLHPVQPFIPPHFATKDAVVGGYLIPKGSHILISRYGVGRNPEAWEDPLTFDPERHVKSGAALRRVITDPTLGFITFGVGRRSCVAATLGTTMTVMLLARLLHAFDWTLPRGTTKVNLDECEDELFLAEPLRACATPRLPSHLYQFENGI